MAAAGRRDLPHATSQLPEEQPVTGGCGGQQGTFVTGVPGEQHRHHVEEGGQLVTQVHAHVVGGTHRVEVHDRRSGDGGENGERRRDRDPDRTDARRPDEQADRRRGDQAEQCGDHEQADVGGRVPTDQAQWDGRGETATGRGRRQPDRPDPRQRSALPVPDPIDGGR